ncbi:MAG: hypothetical protein IPK60_18805 [Sandaracinaceae bacterium]|nr:hypothetical protein [Sandaracinaceae bacterium]
MLRSVRYCGVIVVLVTATAGVAFATPRLSELFHGGDAPVSVGGVPRGLTSVDSQSCSSCHAEIAAEWRSSLHAQSFRDEVFQASYAVEPSAFCRNCHAPLMQAGEREPDANAIAEGVSCAVCHVREEHVLGAHMPDPSAPHASMRLAQMTSSEFCAGCHQFNFPTSNVHRGDLATTSEPMQNTYRE